ESAGSDGAEARSCVADDGAGRRDKHYGVVSGPHRVDVDCFLGSAVCSSSSINARARDSPGFVVDDVKVSLNTNTSKPERAEPAGRCFPSHCGACRWLPDLPGERIPVDGVVLDGSAAVNLHP